MKKTAKILITLATLVFVVIAMALVVSADTNVQIDGVWYGINTGNHGAYLLQKNKTDCTQETITIKDSFEYGGELYTLGSTPFYCAAWNSGNALCFNGNTYIKHVTIEAGIKHIPQNEFLNCTSLETVTFEDTAQSPSQCTLIGYNAFRGCTSLTTINLPASIKNIYSAGNDPLFGGCTSLTTVTFDAGWTYDTIEGGMFKGCSALKSITLPNTITTVGDSAFKECTALESINFGTSLTTFSGSNVLHSSPSIKYLYLPKTFATVSGYNHFYVSNVGAAQNMIIFFAGTKAQAEALKTAFTSATNCQRFTNIPDANYVEYDASTNYETLRAGGSYVVYNTSECFEFYNNEHTYGTPSVVSQGSCTTDATMSETCSRCGYVHQYVVTAPGHDWTNLNGICKVCQTACLHPTVESDVCTVCGTTIEACNHQWTVYPEDPATCFAGGHSEYSQCSLCQKKIGYIEYAQLSHNYVYELNYPTRTASGNYGYRCTLCQTIDTSRANATVPAGYSSIKNGDNVEFVDSATLFDGYPNALKLKSTYKSTVEIVFVPEGTTDLGSDCFNGCSATTIYVADSVKTVGQNAFRELPNCTTIDITENSELESFGKFVFYNSRKLTSIYLPKNLKNLGPTSGNEGYGIFRDCVALTTVTFSDEITQLTDVPGNTFQGCSSLTAIKLPNSVTYLGANAFNNASSLKSINLGASLTTIDGFSNFNGASKLNYFYLSKTLTSVSPSSGTKGYQFYACNQSIIFFFNGTKAEALAVKELFATAGNNGAFTNIAEAKYVEYDPTVNYETLRASQGSHVVYGMTTCDEFYDGVHAYADDDYDCTTGDTCTRCSYAVAGEANHNWDDGEQTSDPDCTTKGVMTYQCQNVGCNQVKTEDIKALGHTESTFITDTEPTCTTDGSKHTECTVCHATVQANVTIPALGHTMSHTDAQDSTCSALGNLEYYYCSECKKYFADNDGATELQNIEVAMKSHVFTGTETITYANGLDQAGLKQVQCANCVATDDTVLEAIITVYGYSTCEVENNGQIIAGYSINQNALAIYEGAGKSFTFGVLVGFGDNTVATNFANVIAGNENEKVFGIEVDTSYARVNITIEGFVGATEAQIPLVICAFTKENDTVAYYQKDTGTEITGTEFLKITYAELTAE